MTRVSIGIGSNIGDPIDNVQKAFQKLAELDPKIERSRLYWSKPWGVKEQPDFCNAAAVIDVQLPPQELLQRLQQIEKDLGREREIKWGPRIIDLDILTFGDLVINDENLIIPHPHMLERVFVLVPLVDLIPEFASHLSRFTQEELAEVVPANLPR